MDRPPQGRLFDGQSGAWLHSRSPFVLSEPTPQWAKGKRHQRRGQDLAGLTGVNGARRIRRRVPPGRTGRIALCVSTRIDSSIAEFGSRHRASSPRWKRLGHEARRGSARRAPLQASRPKGMWRLFHPKPRYGRAPCPLTRVARVEVRCASSCVGGRTPAVCARAHQAR